MQANRKPVHDKPRAGLRQVGGPVLYFLAPAILLCAVLPAVNAHADLAATIAALQRRYALVDSLSADFTQIYHSPGMDQTESGVVYMKRPGLMRWEYRIPEEKLFVADGRDTYLYTPADRQVLVKHFTLDDLRATPIQLLLGQGDLKRNYDVAWDAAAGAQEGGAISLRLTPRAANADYAYVVLQCDAASFDLRRILIRDRTGDTSEFLFSNFKANAKVNAQQFQFRIPKGVEVVRLDEKQEG